MDAIIYKSVESGIYAAAIERLRIRTDDIKLLNLLASCMVAQSKYETGNYTSNVYLKNNNAFGYKYYKGSIYQSGVVESGAYGFYSSYIDSAREVADWIGRRWNDFKAVTDVNSYAAALKKNDYFEQQVLVYALGMSHYFVLFDPISVGHVVINTSFMLDGKEYTLTIAQKVT
jgi:hypothetical protein